jgi:hypothetical protein
VDRTKSFQQAFVTGIVALAVAGLPAALLLNGCAASLNPAPEARTIPGKNLAAFVEVAGVRMVIVPDQWSGSPADLGDLATPLHVTIENRSNQPLRFRYGEFKLLGSRGFKAIAMAPYKIEGTVIEPVFLPQTYVYPGGLQLAPHYRTHSKDTSKPRHPWNYDEYTPLYNLWASPLPTEDMLAKGIPEGVLEPNGHVSGFFYFDKLPENLERLTFEADLVNAQTGDLFGTVRIPFLVK